MQSTWFISDLHLDNKKPELFTLFQHFVQNVPEHVEALYIMGDLFEYWVGDDIVAIPQGQLAQNTAILLKQLSQRMPLYFIHGNRDFAIGEQFAKLAGMSLLPEKHVLTLYGKKLLIMHGDTLCIDDVSYQQFRQMSRNPDWLSMMLQKPIAERIQFADAVRVASKEAAEERDEQQSVELIDEIMDVNPVEVMKDLKEHQVDWLIHGHTHRPADHCWVSDGVPWRRTVLGDWVTQPSILSISEEEVSLDDGRGNKQILKAIFDRMT